MLTQHIALVPETDSLPASALARVSAALQKQVTRDLAPLWSIHATVDAFPQLDDVPVGYWPIIVSGSELGREAGVHLDESGQPYALVELSPSWSIDASRVCLEMLVNPLGDRKVVAPSLRSDQGQVEFMIEICAPCEDAIHAYAINDVLVSDFATPAYFDAVAATGARYSFHGSLLAPFAALPGGHTTWYDALSDSWWLRSHWGAVPTDTRLGTVDRRFVSVRELSRRHAPLRSWSLVVGRDTFEARARLLRQHAMLASQTRAHRLRLLLGKRMAEALPAGGFGVLERAKETSTKLLPAPSQADEAIDSLAFDDLLDEANEALLDEANGALAEEHEPLELQPAIGRPEQALDSHERPTLGPPPLRSSSVPAPVRSSSLPAAWHNLPANAATTSSLAPVSWRMSLEEDQRRARAGKPMLAVLLASAALGCLLLSNASGSSLRSAASQSHARTPKSQPVVAHKTSGLPAPSAQAPVQASAPAQLANTPPPAVAQAAAPTPSKAPLSVAVPTKQVVALAKPAAVLAKPARPGKRLEQPSKSELAPTAPALTQAAPEPTSAASARAIDSLIESRQ